MRLVIREATRDDAQQVAELLTELGSKGVDAAEAARRLERRIERIFVADDGDRLLGLLAVKTELYFGHARPLTHVTAVVTRASARRGGVARKLMEAAFAFAHEKSCFGIELTCGISQQREAAHRFYPTLGFEITSRRYSLNFDEDPPEDGVRPALLSGRAENALADAVVRDDG